MSTIDGIGKRGWRSITSCNQFCNMWNNMEARWSYSQYWNLGPLKKKMGSNFRRCFRHRKSWRSLFGSSVRSEIMCEIDQSMRWTNFRQFSKSLYLSGSVQRTSSKEAKNPWSPAIISKRRPSCTSRVWHDRCIRTLSIIWRNFSCRSWRSAISGNLFCSCRWLWFEDGPKL